MNVISLGMSSIHPTGPLCRRTMSPTLAYVRAVPCTLGVNTMSMAVVHGYNPHQAYGPG